jgi:hypothetical protein
MENLHQCGRGRVLLAPISPVSHTFDCWVVILAPRERCEHRDLAGRTDADVPGKFE